MVPSSKIDVAGHQGLVGSALMRSLHSCGYGNTVVRTLEECDLRNQHAVDNFFEAERPEYVFLLAAKVGGIYANMTRPAEFIYDNLIIACNVIEAAYRYNVKKLLFLGSSCIYPRQAQQPIREDALLQGPLEPTNQPYALAKLAGIELCKSYNRQYGTDFIAAMPTNLYGSHDNFSLQQSHVIPALIAKFCHAVKTGAHEVVVGGSGNVFREFLYVDDCVQALIFLMNNYSSSEIVNIGVGADIKISDLVYKIAQFTGFQGNIVWDSTFPDGTPRKLLDVSKIHELGWRAATPFDQGLQQTIVWYKENAL